MPNRAGSGVGLVKLADISNNGKERQLRDVVGRLIKHGKAANGERRSERRQPLFAPIHVRMTEGNEHWFSAFSTDVSRIGIGMLHAFPVAPGPAIVTMRLQPAEAVRVRVNIIWCRACGESWYISGAKFVDVADF